MIVSLRSLLLVDAVFPLTVLFLTVSVQYLCAFEMAEACASRTHRRRANPPPAGFEDREDHRTPCASVLVELSTLLWLSSYPQIRLQSPESTGKFLPRLVIGYRRRNDDVVARFPIHRRSYIVLCGELQRIQHAHDFVKIAPTAHGITEHHLDLLVRANNKYGTHGRIVSGSAAFRAVSGLSRKHVIELCHLKFGVADHRIIDLVPLRLFDIVGPFNVIRHRVDAQADDLAIALSELGLQAGHVTKLGRAYRSEILGVRKQNRPTIPDPLVKIDFALGGFSGKVRSFGIYAQRHSQSSLSPFDAL